MRARTSHIARQRRVTIGAIVFALAGAMVFAGGPSAGQAAQPSPPFTQCPPVGRDTSCGILIVVNADNSTSVLVDKSQGPFDGNDDTLIGVLNNSASPLSTLPISSGTAAFDFDGDGLCNQSPRPSGCPFGPTRYEGPGTSFSNVSADKKSGVVSFANPVPSGGSAYFSLEAAITQVPPNTITPGQPNTGGVNYLALGDSFSSGEGNDPFSAGTDNPFRNDSSKDGCHRSLAGAYPEFLKGDLTAGSSFGFVACSGAKTSAFSQSYKNEPAQFDTITAPTNLMTLTVGGDDIGFAPILIYCVVVNVSRPCRNFFQPLGPNGPDIISNNIRALYPRLLSVLQRLAAHGGSTYFLGYPQLIPASPSPEQGRCLAVFLNPSDWPYLREKASELNNVLARAASAAGVHYVDVEQAFESDPSANHELCSGGSAFSSATGAWVHAPQVPIYRSFHPTVDGQREFYRLLSARRPLSLRPNPAPVATAPPPQPAAGSTLAMGIGSAALTLSGADRVVHVIADGFDRGARVLLRRHSDPVDLPPATADSNGVVDQTFDLPRDIGVGWHMIEARGQDPDGNDRLVVAPFFIDQQLSTPPGSARVPPPPPPQFPATQVAGGYLTSPALTPFPVLPAVVPAPQLAPAASSTAAAPANNSALSLTGSRSMPLALIGAFALWLGAFLLALRPATVGPRRRRFGVTRP